MNFKLLFQSAKDVCQNSPVLVSIIVLLVLFSIFVMVDAHRNKKKRPRHRWK